MACGDQGSRSSQTLRVAGGRCPLLGSLSQVSKMIDVNTLWRKTPLSPIPQKVSSRVGAGAVPLVLVEINKLRTVLGSPGLWSVSLLACPGLFWFLLGSAGLSWALLGPAGIPWALLGSTVRCWPLLVSPELCSAALSSPGVSWALLGSGGLYWAGVVATPPSLIFAECLGEFVT